MVSSKDTQKAEKEGVEHWPPVSLAPPPILLPPLAKPALGGAGGCRPYNEAARGGSGKFQSVGGQGACQSSHLGWVIRTISFLYMALCLHKSLRLPRS